MMRLKIKMRPKIKKNNSLLRWVERLLLLAGMLALGIWVGSKAIPFVWEDWDNWVFDHQVRGEQISVVKYLEEKKDQVAREVGIWLLGLPAGPEPSASSTTPPPPRRHFVKKNGVVGRLTIPRLHLIAMVREGAGENTLSLALGHIPTTAFPGEPGNVGVAGHRDTIFRALREIQEHDVIKFETLAGSYFYEVQSTEIVKPQDVSVLKAGNYSQLTLVTCYPFYYVGSAPDRFIVKARQVSQTPAEPRQTKVLASYQPASHAPEAKQQIAGKRIGFTITKNHSRELASGVSLGVTGTDVTSESVDGWMWVMPDRRTIWLRNQGTRDPVVFYGHEDGKRRELLITSVTRDSATGYLLLPGE
jgi:sortase A